MSQIFTLAELAEYLNADIVGDATFKIHGLAALSAAGPDDLSFITNANYLKSLEVSSVGALIVTDALADHFSGHKLIVPNPYLAFAIISKLFDKSVSQAQGVHPSAVIGENCQIGERVSIGAHCVIGNNVVLGDDVQIGPGTCIGDDCIIGARTKTSANVSIYRGVTIGDDCLFHSSCVIGADGFGFAPSPTGWVKIHQLGGVVIGNKVEIGANTCIDRGALDDTVIGDGVIIDNLVQIAHNCRIGKYTAIAGHTGIAGSTTIGERCTIAGAVGIVGHIEIANDVHIQARAMVSHSIKEAGSYSSGTPVSTTREWRKNAARFRQLDALATRLIKLERKLSAE